MKDKITVNGKGYTKELHLTSVMWNRFAHVMSKDLLKFLQDKYSVAPKVEIDMHHGFNYKLHVEAEQAVVDAVAEDIMARFEPPKLEKNDAAQGWEFNFVGEELILFSPKGQECDGFLEWYDIKLLETSLHQCGIAFDTEEDGDEIIGNVFEIQEEDLDSDKLVADLQKIGFTFNPQLQCSDDVHRKLFGRLPAPAYLIGRVQVTDAAQYDKYAQATGPIVAQFGGQYIVRGATTTALEGPADKDRLVILRFPSAEQAKGFYNSPEYQTARKLRATAAVGQFLLVEGVPESGTKAGK